MTAEKRASLFFSDIEKGGTSDKEYHLQLVQNGSGYLVNYQNGRRGQTMTNGTLTKTPVTLEEATTIYARKLAAKLKDDYQLKAGVAQDAPVMPLTPMARTEFPAELLEEIDEADGDRLIAAPGYILQVKVDGHRRQIEKKKDGEFVSYNRKGQATGLPSEVVFDLKKISAESFLIDGELVGNAFVAFDIFTLRGKDISSKTYVARLAILEALIFKREALKYATVVASWHTPDEKMQGMAALKRIRAEGAVFKMASAPYIPGRNGQHKKFKFVKSLSAVVTQIGHKGHNSATIGLYDGRELTEVAHVSLNGKEDIKKGMVVEVNYLYATEGKRLYQARLAINKATVIRTDVDPEDCTFGQVIYKQGVSVG